ncbi:DUF6779 domain-containing protein [Gordonia liuliyuniae]|uniref:DUF6779 domain-containing protein n=1 Tax=Gordonia liuliyuniae TaxID=2911517 RepID=UPI002245E496|nr:DUF6779 domain-containing protein [Gordonia liuliyuniae]
MTEEAHSGQTRSSRPSAGQWAIALLIVLALAASLLMVFSDDLSMQATLAVIAALWAAVIGAVLVTKYRRQADTAENRTRDLRLVYELQLEREIAARRQYESDVESSIRHELADEANHELDELKAQVLALRSSLEQLLGKPLPESRIAIGLERPRELGAGLTAAASYADVADDHAAAERDFASTAPQAENGRHVPEQADEPTPVEMTEIIPVVTDDPAAVEPDPAAEQEPEPGPEPEPEREPEQEQAPRPAPPQWRPQAQRPPAPAPQQQRYPQPPPMPQAPQRPGAPRFPVGPQQQGQPQQGQPQAGGHQRAAFGAGAYEPPSAPFRAQQGPQQQQAPQNAQPKNAQPQNAQPQDAQSQDVEPEIVGDDGAHASGRPASELLSRLREGAAGGGPATGGHGRRRRD